MMDLAKIMCTEMCCVYDFSRSHRLNHKKEDNFSIMLDNEEYIIEIKKGFQSRSSVKMLSLDYGNNIKVRKASNEEGTVKDFYDILNYTEQLFMIGDGYFYPLIEISISSSNMEQAENCSEYLKRTRLKFYSSTDYVSASQNRIFNFHENLTQDYLNDWINLLRSIGFLHEVYLYAISDCHVPKEMMLPFLIEIYKPLVKITEKQKYTNFKDVDTLKKCVNQMINAYGSDIFVDELKSKDTMDSFLSKVVSARNKMMHIDGKNPKQFDALETVTYTIKFYFFYRCVLLQLLGVPYDSYKKDLKESLTDWNLCLQQRKEI